MSNAPRSSVPQVVLATVGHNEAERLEATLEGLIGVSQPGDEVWLVDSGSTDRSIDIAAGMGVRVLRGPVGKGAAMGMALSEISFSDWLCFFDGDLSTQSFSIGSALRHAVNGAEPGMVVGQFWSDEPSLLPATHGIYGPLVEALFPEVNDRFGTRPLSGFRAVSRGVDPDLPSGFGVEAFLNLSVALRGLATKVVDVGPFSNPFRFKPQMPLEISSTILDVAQAEGRLPSSERVAWESWVEGMVGPLRDYRGESAKRSEILAHLRRWLAEPRPG